MTNRPQQLTDRPPMQGDVISDVLRAVRLSGAIFFDIEAAAPWAAETPPAAQVAPILMPHAQYVIEYHVITRGAAWLRIAEPGGEAVRAEGGSVVMFPHGDAHILSSTPELRAPPNLELFERSKRERPVRVCLSSESDGKDVTHVICGFLGCDARPFNPLINALPRLLHVAGAYSGDDGWLSTLIGATIQESRQPRVGSSSVLSRLSELLFVEVVRRYVESLPEADGGWLNALRDPYVGKALRLLHAQPTRDWALPDLAREVGMSRTVLVERFSAQVGVAPMTYLQNWRMQLAAGLLSSGSATIAAVAADVGYDSEAAFSRAFKRRTGLSPALWRASANQAADNRLSP